MLEMAQEAVVIFNAEFNNRNVLRAHEQWQCSPLSADDVGFFAFVSFSMIEAARVVESGLFDM